MSQKSTNSAPEDEQECAALVWDRLGARIAELNLPALSAEATDSFGKYLSHLLRWNAQMNLTAVRDPGAIVERHFVECIACAAALPSDIGTLLDFGSGAGFPGIPIAICRSEIAVTLAESQNKKAAFLREAVRRLGLKAEVSSGRAEAMEARFDCVTLRAVERMESAVQAAVGLLRPNGWLAPLTTCAAVESIKAAAGPSFGWLTPIPLPGKDRILGLGRRRSE